VLTGLLRDELGYDGLIATDSLEMGALATNGYPPQVAAPLALAAGADLLLFNRDHAIHGAAFANLIQAVREGKISQEQLDTSVQRILQVKERFGLLHPTPVDVNATASVKTQEHLALSRELAQKAITLIRDPLGLLPLKPTPTLLIVETPATRDLMKILDLGGTTFLVDTEPTASQIADILDAARNEGTVILPVNDLSINLKQLRLVQELVEMGIPVIALAHRNPFDATLLPERVTVLVTYGFNLPIREALTAVLKGRNRPLGVLPVTLQSARIP
jgi:beta-N-acetylhexosaminidase